MNIIKRFTLFHGYVPVTRSSHLSHQASGKELREASPGSTLIFYVHSFPFLNSEFLKEKKKAFLLVKYDF